MHAPPPLLPETPKRSQHTQPPPPPPQMPPELPSPASSDDTVTFSDERPSPESSDDTPTFSNKSPSLEHSDDTATLSDERSSSPSSFSFSLDSTAESDASPSSSEVSDRSSGSEPAAARTLRTPKRSWPAEDEITLLEAVGSHREKHGRLPSPDDLAASLRGRLRADGRIDAQGIAKQLHGLQVRYVNAVIRLSRGIIPVKDGDFRIYKLSKLIWGGTRRNKEKQDPRLFLEMAGLYPCLAAEVEAITAECLPAAGVLKRAFGRIGDDRAVQLEAKVKRQLVAEATARAELDSLRGDVACTLLKLIK